jgi:hypothetical protein
VSNVVENYKIKDSYYADYENDVNEEIYSLYDYLPVLYKDENEREYVQTLFKALTLSYSNGLYQFAYIQLHMIFMVCIYYLLLQLNINAPDELEKAIYYLSKDNRAKDFYGGSNTRNGELYFGSFAMLNESYAFLLLKIAGMDSDLQGELRKLVEERNKYAHANGNITITSQATIDERISKYINTLERVQKLFKPIIEDLYLNTLANPDFSDSENRLGYLDDNEQIQEEFIKKFYLSKKELNVCRKANINQLSEKDGFEAMKNLHIALCNYYKSLSDDEAELSAVCA